jgi:hypothetical protein
MTLAGALRHRTLRFLLVVAALWAGWGVQGTTVLLNRVPPADVRQIARYYWVRRIAAR